MKIGDKVRFLSEAGGGRISGFKGNNIVLVEDEDGFEIPMTKQDVVVVQSDDYSIAKIVSAKTSKAVENAPEGLSIRQRLSNGISDDEIEEDYDPADKEITFKTPVAERKGGNKLSAYLAFVPINVKEFTNTNFECYIVNDSNYYLRYNYLLAEGNSWQLHHEGEIEPNTKYFVEEIGRESLDDMQHLAIQAMALKREKPFIIKPVMDVQLRLDPVKFYKLHCFQTNDFFEQPAMLFTIIENDEQPRPMVIDAKTLKQQMYKSGDNENKTPVKAVKKKDRDEVVVIDLHATEVLETTAGMSNGDILEYQLKVFRDTLAEYSNKKGQKIVFIHGKGEGVLRRAIISELTYKYKRYQYQDASFQEYGWGATQVIIR